MISIVIPIHNMKNGAFFLWRAINSIMEQTFKDYEIVIVKEGSMPVNTNAGIKKARGEIVKILYMDDWLNDKNYLDTLYKSFNNKLFSQPVEWLITKATTNPDPHWTDEIVVGNNKLGSPSALAFRNHFEDNLLFDERLSWMLDCELYWRLNKKYGKPHIVKSAEVGIGEHDGQMTYLMSDDYKYNEQELVKKLYE